MSEAVVQIETSGRSYPVMIGHGNLSQCLERGVGKLEASERAAIVTDSGVPSPWVEEVFSGLVQAGLEVSVFSFLSGEQSKTLTTCSDLLSGMARFGLHRNDVIVGVGGGVVTDVAGFLASVYMRGVELFHVPTTLLAMVDAAIGGKTGVNLEGWKNLIGTFYQPSLVACDIRTLKTLPDRELRTGLAEVLKYGFIAKPELLDTAALLATSLDKEASVLEEEATIDLVRSCVQAKADVVGADEKESGLREILNFGHTLGHALEKVSGNKLNHGEAIAIGMLFEAELSRLEIGADSELVKEISERLCKTGLPISVQEAGVRVKKYEILDAMSLDKKYKEGIRFVLLSSFANPVVRKIEDLSKIEKSLGLVGIE